MVVQEAVEVGVLRGERYAVDEPTSGATLRGRLHHCWCYEPGEEAESCRASVHLRFFSDGGRPCWRTTSRRG